MKTETEAKSLRIIYRLNGTKAEILLSGPRFDTEEGAVGTSPRLPRLLDEIAGLRDLGEDAFLHHRIDCVFCGEEATLRRSGLRIVFGCPRCGTIAVDRLVEEEEEAVV